MLLEIALDPQILPLEIDDHPWLIAPALHRIAQRHELLVAPQVEQDLAAQHHIAPRAQEIAQMRLHPRGILRHADGGQLRRIALIARAVLWMTLVYLPLARQPVGPRLQKTLDRRGRAFRHADMKGYYGHHRACGLNGTRHVSHIPQWPRVYNISRSKR